jgi:formylglycine-generating enzyme required for sulfatase activity
VLRQEPIAPSELNPTLSPAWDKVVARAMAKKPEARFASARQFAEAIKAAHSAERAHEDEGRRKAAEAEEHAHRAAEERSRAESLRRAEDERREAERRAHAETEARNAAEARATREAEERMVLMKKPARGRVPAIMATILIAVVVVGVVLYRRQSADEKSKAEMVRKTMEARREAKNPGAVLRDCDDCPEMVVVPAGSFLMGSPDSEKVRFFDEAPQHQVTIARPFAVGRYEVTFEEWDSCVQEKGCSYNPSDEGWGRGRLPVINVSWRDVKQYAEWLSRKTGKRYRLLTESEWEYAARAGTTTAYNTGAEITPSQAQVDGRPLTSVGSHGPNAFGLYDMHGNALEWTEDCWNDSYVGAPVDGSAWLAGDCSARMIRGGSWFFNSHAARSAKRMEISPDWRAQPIAGFRLASTLE